jgi:tetratricopeptide (TPR) repeat protein
MEEGQGQFSEDRGKDTMLLEAIDALRQGDRTRARDLLTRLLKVDQKNADYWVWLSAAVETQKERLYCLQMAIQADPENAAAKRGLILFGSIHPDDSVPPFPLNRPRLWMEKLTAPKETSERKRCWANPVIRFFILLGISVTIIGGLLLGRSWLSNKTASLPLSTSTHRPTITPSSTVTMTPIFRTSTPTFLGPTPLWMFLQSTYTPTPLYVITQHPIVSRSAFDAGLRFLAAKDYPNALVLFQQAISLEPDAPDLYYYVGETYLAQEDYRHAGDAYQQAINIDPEFAPAFLGRAEVNQALNQNAKIIDDMNQAIILDPNFTEAYLVRGAYLIESDPAAAKDDLETTIDVSPNSALAFLYLAEAQMNLDENEAALESAIRANELDMTLVPVYLTLGRAYIAEGQFTKAVSVLQTYIIFRPEDFNGLLLFGTTCNAAGDYEKAVETLTQAISLDQHDPEAYFQRGTAYLNLQDPNLAEADFKAASAYDPNDFDSALGLARVYYLQGKPGNAYMQVLNTAYPLARSDITKAQAYYWQATFLEAIGDKSSLDAARNYWLKLISLSPQTMPETWREEAYQHLGVTPTYTPTTSPTKTLTPTPTMSPTKTPTATLISSLTKTGTITPAVSASRSPAATP